MCRMMPHLHSLFSVELSCYSVTVTLIHANEVICVIFLFRTEIFVDTRALAGQRMLMTNQVLLSIACLNIL